MATWKEMKPELMKANPFQRIGKDWMLITAEKEGIVNTMTASWGGFGVMWGRNVVYTVIRPQRYTKEFVDGGDTFSLTFFPDGFREQLSYLGAVSGRTEDKITKAGLTVVKGDIAPYFAEGNLVILCKKLYAQPMQPDCFYDKAPEERYYPQKDYHTLYIAEVMKVLEKEI